MRNEQIQTYKNLKKLFDSQTEDAFWHEVAGL